MFNLPPKTKNSREQIQQIETKEKQPANLSPLNKVALALGTVAVINISYTPIHSYFNHTDINQAAKADRLYEPYDATPDLDNSYPLSKRCPEATHLSGKALGIALENCGKELNWKQEEIDYENKVNSNMLAMLFLFWLDIGGGSPKPSASQIDSLATRVSKTPKQSTTFPLLYWRTCNAKS